MPEDKRRLLTLKETASSLSVCERTIRNFVKRGLLHPNRSTRLLLFRVEEIDSFAAGEDTSRKEE